MIPLVLCFLLYGFSMFVAYRKIEFNFRSADFKERAAKVLESGIEVWGGILACFLSVYFFLAEKQLRLWQVFYIYLLFVFFQCLDYFYDYLAVKLSRRKNEF